MYAAVNDILQVCKVRTIWVPRQWTEEQKWSCMDVCVCHLACCDSEEEKFLIDVIMGYETWCYCCEPKST